MATAAPHVKLLRQLASAKDDYLSGAFDISWDGAKATLYLVFGRPSHAVFETDQERIEGEAAIDALLAALPRAFVVSDWRRAMSPHETLSITIDELAGPFVRLAGSYADDPVADEDPEWWSAVDDAPDLPFGLADFPLLPGGRPLWVEGSPEEIRLADRLAGLPPSILILTGAKLRAAAVVSGGDLIDAVWLDSDDHARGETAGMALLGATKGSLAGYALDDPRVAEALTMLWRLPLAVSGVELSWLDPASMLAAFRADGLDRVLVIDAPVRGIALFSRGGLVAVYSETQRSAVASPERLRSLLSQARGRLTVMERKPRPVASETSKPVSAHDFFEVSATEPVAAEPLTVEPEAEPSPVGDSDPVPHAESAAAEAVTDAETVASVDAAGEADTGTEPAPSYGFRTFDRTSADTETAPAAAPDVSTDASESTVADAHTPEAPGTDAASIPPPPPDAEVAGLADDNAPPPPPPAPEATEPAAKPKRSRWGFGRSRKSRAEKKAAEAETAAAVEAEALEAEPPSFAGWSVRQPNEEPVPGWQRSHDLPDGSTTETPETPQTETGSDETPVPTWSLVRAGDAPSAEPNAHVEADTLQTPGDTDDSTGPMSAGDSAVEATAPIAEDAPVVDEKPEVRSGSSDHAFEFASFDDATPAPAEPAPAETWLSASWLDDVVSGDEPQTPAASDTEADQVPDQPRPILRTPGPWSWPLAEPDDAAHPSGASKNPDEAEAPDMERAAVAASRHEESTSGSNGSDSSFFQRDEPVGSQYVDFDEVRSELVQIGVVWLGEANAVQVTALLSSTRSTIDDFVATIDTIRGLHIDGQDPASIQAMAREMHQQAAERLCGA